MVIQATLKPACMNRVDVFFDAIEKRPVFKPIIAKREWVFENDRMQVVINTSTGLVDSWKVDGEEYLKKFSKDKFIVRHSINISPCPPKTAFFIHCVLHPKFRGSHSLLLNLGV